MFVMQNARPLSRELLTLYLLNTLDGPSTHPAAALAQHPSRTLLAASLDLTDHLNEF